jgi:hypothetical protein
LPRPSALRDILDRSLFVVAAPSSGVTAARFFTLAARSADLAEAGATQAMPMVRLAFMLASTIFLNSLALLAGTPKISAVSSGVGNRESILTGMMI